jgi:asparagine synthetase A
MFHQQALQTKCPLSIGGGIGKSRINMFLLEQDDIKKVKNFHL